MNSVEQEIFDSASEMVSVQTDFESDSGRVSTVRPGVTASKKKQRTISGMPRAPDKRKRVFSPEQDPETVSEAGAMVAEVRELIDSSSRCTMKAIEDGNIRLWEKIDRRLSAFESRIEQVEAENFTLSRRVDELEQAQGDDQRRVQEMSDQVDQLKRHSRSVNLIVHSRRLGRRRVNEDIAIETIQLLK